jgi:hypothetical protein
MSRRLPETELSAATSDLILSPVWLNHVLTVVGNLDAWLCRLLRIPWGSSVFAMARKPIQAEGAVL